MTSQTNSPRLLLIPVPSGQLQIQKLRSKKKGSSFLVGNPPSKDYLQNGYWDGVPLGHSLSPPTHPPPPLPLPAKSDPDGAYYPVESDDYLELVMPKPLSIVKSEPKFKGSDST